MNAIEYHCRPLDEQHEIVRRVEALFKIADDIEKRYEKAKAHVDKLTQSILAKAFRGELVPQDPNDEPASELLKRIQEERRKPEGRGPAQPKEHKSEGEKLINAADSYRPGNFSPKNPPSPLFQRGRNEATIPICQSYFSHVPLPERGVEKNLQQTGFE